MRPAWFSVLDDEDQTFFRNPTRVFLSGLVGDPMRDLVQRAGDGEAFSRYLAAVTEGVESVEHFAACVGRCAYRTAQVLDELGTPGPWIQCGAAARPMPDGELLCTHHARTWWHCGFCEGPLPTSAPSPEGAFCSKACAAEAEAGEEG